MTRDFYINHFSSGRLGEGDACLRDIKTKRICAWKAGMTDEEWSEMLAKRDVYASCGMWDKEKGMIV